MTRSIDNEITVLVGSIYEYLMFKDNEGRQAIEPIYYPLNN
jgi:hypothetical protein